MLAGAESSAQLRRTDRGEAARVAFSNLMAPMAAARTCQYPLTDEPPHKFCGKRAVQRSYCAEHYDRCYSEPVGLFTTRAKPKPAPRYAEKLARKFQRGERR